MHCVNKTSIAYLTSYGEIIPSDQFESGGLTFVAYLLRFKKGFKKKALSLFADREFLFEGGTAEEKYYHVNEFIALIDANDIVVHGIFRDKEDTFFITQLNENNKTKRPEELDLRTGVYSSVFAVEPDENDLVHNLIRKGYRYASVLKGKGELEEWDGEGTYIVSDLSPMERLEARQIIELFYTKQVESKVKHIMGEK